MNKINIALFKSLVNSEFLILSASCKQNDRKLDYKIISRAQNKVESSLDIFELVKSLKQLVRVLQFLKTFKKKQFIICSSNLNVLSFLDLYKKELKFSESLILESNYKKVKSLTTLRSLLLLEDLPNSEESFSRNFFEKNILILTKVNAAFERNSYGTYKIYNEMSDYKKLMFLMVLIKKAFEEES
jgi:hypothetical protein